MDCITSFNAGVFDVPLSPTMAVQIIAGADQPSFNWIRLVFPIAAAMHVSRGNPCEQPYETYSLS